MLLIRIFIVFCLIHFCYTNSCKNHIQRSNDSKIRLGLLISENDYNILSLEQLDRVCHDVSFHEYFNVVCQLCIPSTDIYTTKSIMETNADIVINSLFPDTLYTYFNEPNLRPSNLAMTTSEYNDIDEIVITWSNKGSFKSWMRSNGFGDYVPNTIDKSKPTFPLMLKATQYAGSTGIFLIKNQTDLNDQLSIFDGDNVKYILEEAITGMRNIEGEIFASSFNGKLLSMRCTLRQVMNESNSDAFVFKFGRTNYQEYVTSCGKDLSTVIQSMLIKSMYTGAFNIDFKANSTLHFKFLDMNPRISGTVAHRIELFKSTYIPLSFAINEYRGEQDKDLKNLFWYNDPKLIEFTKKEKEIVLSGNDGVHVDIISQIKDLS